MALDKNIGTHMLPGAFNITDPEAAKRQVREDHGESLCVSICTGPIGSSGVDAVGYVEQATAKVLVSCSF